MLWLILENKELKAIHNALQIMDRNVPLWLILENKELKAIHNEMPNFLPGRKAVINPRK